METRAHSVDNRDGWLLDLKRLWDPSRVRLDRPPILLVPGYGMNSFVLGYHPSGVSLAEYLAHRGLEVWTANLRGQGESRRLSGPRDYGFRQAALIDLPAMIRAVLERSPARTGCIDALGCSLGGTYLFTWLAHHPEDTRVRGLVTMGAPLRWERTHPLMRIVFASSRVAGSVPFFGTRRFTRIALPLARRIPRLLAPYMNTSGIDLDRADLLTRTVEDPVRTINREIALWIRRGDLVVDGLNITESMRKVGRPLLCVYANQDGIVPRESACSIAQVMRGARVDILRAGDDADWFAHADMFINRQAEAKVFRPIADWLLASDSFSPFDRESVTSRVRDPETPRHSRPREFVSS